MRQILITILCFGLLSDKLTGQTQKLEQERARYDELNQKIFSYSPSSAKQTGDPVEREQILARLQKMLRNQIESELPSTAGNPSQIAEYLSSIQGPELSLSGYDSAPPFADAIELNGIRFDIFAYAILTGGAGIPHSMPFIDIYSFSGEKWRLAAEFKPDLETSQFNLRKVKSPLSGQAWYLVWGKRLGDTGGRLNIRLYGFDGTSIRLISQRDDLVRGQLEATDTSVNLSYIVPPPQRDGPLRDDNRVKETLYITPNGLQ